MNFLEKTKSRFLVIKQSKKPFKLLVAYILRKLNLSSFFTIDKYLYRMKFYPSALLMHYWVDTNAREDEALFLNRVVKFGSTVFDVGANVGTLTLPLACQVGNKGKVISIEANPKTFSYLRGNVEFNQYLKNITLLNTAVGNKNGKLYFSNISSDDMNKVVNKDYENAIEIPVITLDEIAKSNNITKIRLLKIDIEGYELFAFKGASNVLKITEIIFFESWEEHCKNFNYSTVDVVKLLSKYGFSIYKIDNSNLLKEIDENYISLECENLLAFKSKKDIECIYEKN